MKKIKFGDILILTKPQSRDHFDQIPVGTRAVVVKIDPKVVALGFYDATVVFEGYSQEIIDNLGHRQDFEAGYIEKGTYKLSNN